MKKGFFLPLLAATFFSVLHAKELSAINFFQKGEMSQVELAFDTDDVVASKFHIKDDKQIIIDLKDVSAVDKVLRAFDTSEFNGAVVFVSAYKKPNSPNDVRVAIQLRDNVRSVLKRGFKKVYLEIENRFGVFSQNKVEENETLAEKKVEGSLGGEKVSVPKSEKIEDILENIVQSGKKKYAGKKISLNLKEVPPEEILKMIAEASGFNIILTKEVKGLEPLSLNLNNIPWDQALDTVLDINKLVAKRNGAILTITTLQKLSEEEQLKADTKAKSQAQEPLVTKVFPISYASIKEIGEILSAYSTPKRGNISGDERTNSLIIKDTTEVVERMKKIIEVLDTQTPQVLIESKFVEVQEGYAKRIGLERGITAGYDPVGTSTIPGAGTVSIDNSTAGFAFSSAPTASSSIGLGIGIASWKRLRNLNFQLSLMESESKGKIISSPKIITQNKKKASIVGTDSQTFLLESITPDGVTVTGNTIEVKLSLDVTPQVTNDGSISLEIAMEKGDVGARESRTVLPPVSKRNITTNVLVDNGSTVMLGGLYYYKKTEGHSGIPVLKDIPLLGWLFRTPYNPDVQKKEMVIFMTPRIVNQEEAGLVGDNG